jgi:uridine phosphorylase
MTKKDFLLPVMKVHSNDLARRALVVGDPQRAEDASRLLAEARLVGSNREYVTYFGKVAGEPLVVCSHGVGAAGASVCFTELLDGGVEVIVRAGTCGALKEEIDDGSLIVGTAAIREDGTSDQLIPLAYPAFADAGVVQALEKAASAQGKFYSGVVLTQAHLYPGLQPSTVDLWCKAGAVAIEMEYAALLVIASLRGARAGGIFTSDGNLVRKQAALSSENYDPHREVVKQGVQRMLQAALEALAQL